MAEQEPAVHAGEPAPAAGAQPVDLEKLAEQVYRQMLAEVRLEKARGERPRGGR